MQGPKAGNRVAGVNVSGWTPTVANLVVLIVLEIAAYCVLRYVFRTVHAG